MPNKTSAPAQLIELVEEFRAGAVSRSPTFKEDWTRTDYIEPMLQLLGWERLNQADRTTHSTGYVREQEIDVDGLSTVPDYSMYVNGRRMFYVEAKKPSINISNDKATAFQIREYGWNSGDPIGVLTDFEELAVYNCRLRPDDAQDASTGRVQYMDCSQYADNWPWIEAHFSPDAVADGALSRLADEFRPKNAMRQVDETLLQDIELWRIHLAKDIHSLNVGLDSRDLSFAVQTTIDRILFLRVAEARALEAEGSLAEAAEGPGIYQRLMRLFDRADVRYNSGLFHFSAEKDRPSPDDVTPSIQIGDGILRVIIERLTDKHSPYLFDIMPADILGQMYEQMLGKQLELDDEGDIQLVLRPEIQKAGGVYYTPDFVVRHIVQQTLDPLLEGKTPNQVSNLRIIDPSCGSGSFLLGAYQYLLDWHLAYYANLQKPPPTAARRVNNTLFLTTDERKRILLNNVFGVDIDAQAVEVARLSLLLKVVEGETQLALAVERLLPDLHNNIKCGNSLVGSDYYEPGELFTLTDEELDAVNAFDWVDSFPTVAVADGFDAVVGNPPWLMAGYYLADAKKYLQRHYSTWTGKADLYYLFLEKACRIVRPGGRVGMIVPSKLFHTKAGREIRRILAEDDWVESILDFGIAPVFKGATNYSCILQLSRDSKSKITVTKAGNYLSGPKSSSVERSRLTSDTWHLIPEDRQRIWDELDASHPPLSDFTKRFGTGVQSGRDKLLLFDLDDPILAEFDPEFIRPTLKGRSVRRYRCSPSKVMFFPYREVDGKFCVVELDELGDGLVDYLTRPSVANSLKSRLWFGKDPVGCSGRWYGLMFVDHPWTFGEPHLVTPGISDRSNFAMGDGSIFLTGTAGVNSVVPIHGQAESASYLLALLNSRLVNQYIVDHSTPYQGGYFKFSTNYIKDTPIPKLDLARSEHRSARDDLEQLVQGIAERSDQLSQEGGATQATSRRVVEAAQKNIDEIVEQLYGFDAGSGFTLPSAHSS